MSKDMGDPASPSGSSSFGSSPASAGLAASRSIPIAWEWREYWWGETGRCAVADMTGRIVDHDGDFTTWEVRGPHSQLSHGETGIGAHFDTAREIVEAEIRRRLAYTQGIEAQRAETALAGSVHESPVGAADAPEASSLLGESPTPKGMRPDDPLPRAEG